MRTADDPMRPEDEVPEEEERRGLVRLETRIRRGQWSTRWRRKEDWWRKGYTQRKNRGKGGRRRGRKRRKGKNKERMEEKKERKIYSPIENL